MTINSPLSPSEPSPSDNLLHWGNLNACSLSLAVTKLAVNSARLLVIITKDTQSAQQLQHDINFFSNNSLNVVSFPDRETLPYDHFSPHEDITSARLKTLFQLPQLNKGILIAPIHTLLHKLPPKEYISQHTFSIKTTDTIDIQIFRKQLLSYGYHAVEQVLQHGEFAWRGSILDVFPMGSSAPIRIELFDNDVESLRQFNPDTQRTTHKIEQIELLPAHEYPLTDTGITTFRQTWRTLFTGDPAECEVYQSISNNIAAAGCEYYLPLFFQQLDSFLDYLPKDTLLLSDATIKTIAADYWQQINHRFEQLRYDRLRPLCSPEQLFISVDDWLHQCKAFSRIYFHQDQIPEKLGHINFSCQSIPDIKIESRNKHPMQKFINFINQEQSRILICTESAGRQGVIEDLLKDDNIKPDEVQSWPDFLGNNQRLSIIVHPLADGTTLPQDNICLISENQLFGEHIRQRYSKTNKQLDPNTIIKSLMELKVDAPLIHIEHGVGRYRGLSLIETDGISAEYVTIEYADRDKIYVPITRLDLINRYSGSNPEHAPLQKLGTSQWNKSKQQAQKRACDVAAELLDLYSRRQLSQGFAFQVPKIDYLKFCEEFEFIETPDQVTAITDVLEDMQKTNPMDRLVCGDVGFGKTEVAMRAAFIATQNSKQAIILVPTTLLANQHYQTFCNRFSNWPIKIGILSRLQTQKEQRQTLEKLDQGQIDIIIGTHKLLNTTIQYKELGLLIIDEEHRFGVRQKEKIKSLRANIDILTLTATPIPRTLNMAFSETRDLSIIATAPAKRLQVKTFILENQDHFLVEAITREIMRGGQVYFLHNDIATINTTADKINKLIPQAKLAIAHAKLPERELERIMMNFYHQQYNILVTTTIIESGIDIPSANTIIIDKANHFGLAQLHQLRGRVGRSHHQAYAYLMVNSFKSMTKDAKRRLEALSSIDHLGAGFTLATHDLEIRGAGELLGEEQSGQIHSVGFSLYLDMLDQAITAIKHGKQPTEYQSPNQGPSIDLNTSAIFPADYITDANIRLDLYKRLSDCRTKDAIAELKSESIDRFGMLPPAALQLFANAQLKLKSITLGIEKIKFAKSFGYIHFNQNPNVDFAKIIELIQNQSKIYKLTGPTTLRFNIKPQQDPSVQLHEILQQLQ